MIHVPWALKDSNLGGVNDSIRTMTPDILISVLNPCEANDDGQGEDSQCRGDGIEFGKELENDNKEEESRRARTLNDGDVRKIEMVPYTLAIRRNCSSKLRGRNVKRVYFEVMTWFELYWCSLRTRCFLSKYDSGRG